MHVAAVVIGGGHGNEGGESGEVGGMGSSGGSQDYANPNQPDYAGDTYSS
jgi:hypothetical protein